MGELRFVVRPLTVTGLEGSFRVHIAPEALDKIGLKVGDLCQIVDEDGASGFGIAWRAADRMGTSPKVPPAKISDILRETFGFKQGTQITISSCTKKITKAKTISLTDVTPSDYDGTDDGNWLTRCRALLVNCDAISVGMTFDVAAKKGLKKRFYIEHIEAPGSQDAETLFTHCDTTEVKLAESVAVSGDSTTGKRFDMRLEVDRIGGLTDQIKKLNVGLLMLCKKARQQNAVDDGLPWNSPYLVHGYEGTGKTMLLRELERHSGAKKVIRLDKQQLLSTATKNHAVIQAAFNDALANQPSLIIIDDLEKIAAAADKALSSTVDSLGSAIDAIKGTGVLVVAATRNYTDIDSSLIAPGRFMELLELPVPDRTARGEIIKALLHGTSTKGDNLHEHFGSRTHGFTGKDLGILVHRAQRSATERSATDEEWVKVQSRTSAQDTDDTLVDEAAQSQIDASNTVLESSNAVITIDDFESALQGVKPTALREIILETPQVTWNDIGGSDAVKEQFDKTIGWPIHHPEIFAAFGRSNKQKGVLLYGPPGCSKTMTAQAVANTYGLNFIAVKGAELISMYVGESERAVREIFRKAKAAAPSIIFFDEIDSIGSTRESGSSSGLHVLTTLLNEMDGFETLKGVQVLAATNKPESLDPALLRPGRFDSHVFLGPPTAAARRDILKIATKGLTLQGDVDFEALITATDGYSGAEIVSACDEAALRAMGRAISGAADTSLSREDLEMGIQSTARGITKDMLEAYEAFAHRASR